jgi:hypothetical protein
LPGIPGRICASATANWSLAAAAAINAAKRADAVLSNEELDAILHKDD